MVEVLPTASLIFSSGEDGHGMRRPGAPAWPSWMVTHQFDVLARWMVGWPLGEF